ncbi:MAG: glycosyltransferase [Oscillospiraceae bacterium]|nr:glycosyltransferase [Oscillospiraceae bacterium]
MEKVCILLSTYNGEKYIDEQLKSLLEQKNVEVLVLVHDDGSKDSTPEILRDYAAKYPQIVILEEAFGQNFGVAKGFSFLLHHAGKMFPEIDYFFFCDQDDFWLPEKCCRAVKKLYKRKDRPALYYSKKKLVDGSLNPLPREDKIFRTGSFWDFFDRSNVFGCTMCMTRSLVEQLADDAFYEHPFLHDNYIYRMCLSAKYPIIYDDAETILYRQHGNNVAGAVERNVWRGVKRLFDKDRPHIIREMAQYILRTHSDEVNPDFAEVLKLLVKSEKSFAAKCRLIGMYRKYSRRSVKEKCMFAVMIMTNYF